MKQVLFDDLEPVAERRAFSRERKLKGRLDGLETVSLMGELELEADAVEEGELYLGSPGRLAAGSGSRAAEQCVHFELSFSGPEAADEVEGEGFVNVKSVVRRAGGAGEEKDR